MESNTGRDVTNKLIEVIEEYYKCRDKHDTLREFVNGH